jgi:hypothetical protein
MHMSDEAPNDAASLDPAAAAAAKLLISGRAARLEPRLSRLRERYATSNTRALRSAIGLAKKEERPLVGLLLAEALLRDATESHSPALLGESMFRLATHLGSSQRAGSSLASRQTLAAAWKVMLDTLPSSSPGLRRDAAAAVDFLSAQKSLGDEWRDHVGMSQAEFTNLVEIVARGTKLDATAAPNPSDNKHLFRTMTENAPVPRLPRPSGPAPSSTRAPSWLVSPTIHGGDAVLAASANWRTAVEPLVAAAPNDLGAAWHYFTKGDYESAHTAIIPLLEQLGESWLPSASTDGLRFWHWIRLIHELHSLHTGEVQDRRRSALSAFQLAIRCLPTHHALQESLLSEALNGLEASDLTSARAWSAYTIRAIDATDHEVALALYNNAEKAALRRAWTTNFDLAPGSNSTVNIAEPLVALYNQHVTRLHVSSLGQLRMTESFEMARRSIAPFLDEFEWRSFCEAAELAEEGARLLLTLPTDHSEAVDAAQHLRAMMDAIAISGSLVLQDYVATNLRRLFDELEVAIQRVADTSRPSVTAVLISTRLPFSAALGSEYPICIRLKNGGNAPADEISIRITNDSISLSTVALASQLAAGAEVEIEAIVQATGRSAPALELMCEITWADSLGRDFAQTCTLLAEDQRPASWHADDVNPYSLATISDPERLVGREQDLDSLTALLAGGGSAYITGQKRVGKTSLVRVLINRLTQTGQWAGSVLPLGRALGSDESASNLVYALLDEIREAILQAYPNINLPDAVNAINDNYARVANKWLRIAARSLPPASRVVIAIDDFDELPEVLATGPEADALFLFLRSLIDEAWLNIIVIGSEILPSIIESQEHKLNQVVPVSVTNFPSRSSTEALLVAPASGRLEWAADAIDLVHSTCSGNPYYETLIAHQIWQDLRETNRSFVTASDVVAATSVVSKTAPASHFVHLWADGKTGMDRTSRASMVTSAVLRAVARCGGPELAPASISEIAGVAQSWIQTVTRSEVERVLSNLLARRVVVRADASDSVLVSIPAVGTWLRNAGAQVLDLQYSDSPHATAVASVVTDSDLADLSRGLMYAGEHISEIRIKAWLKQFGDHYQQYLAYVLLRRMVKDGYFTTTRMHDKILPRLKTEVASMSVSRLLQRDTSGYIRNGYLLSHGVPGDSTQGTLSAMCKALKIKKANLLSADQLAETLKPKEGGAVLFVLDDFSGSGGHLSQVATTLMEQLSSTFENWVENIEIVVGAGVVTDLETILPEVLNARSVHKVAGLLLGDRYRAFAPNSGLFSSDKERTDAADLVEVIGKALVPRAPLGFGGDAILALLEFNCPNNAPPIFWRKGSYAGLDWNPLFPRSM